MADNSAMWVLYERVGEPNILSNFIVGGPGPPNPGPSVTVIYLKVIHLIPLDDIDALVF